jgi:hypothetical protein
MAFVLMLPKKPALKPHLPPDIRQPFIKGGLPNYLAPLDGANVKSVPAGMVGMGRPGNNGARSGSTLRVELSLQLTISIGRNDLIIPVLLQAGDGSTGLEPLEVGLGRGGEILYRSGVYHSLPLSALGVITIKTLKT